VVDLGCGGGIDLVLAANRVGETGRVVGIDMTPQMIERARQVIAEAMIEGTVDVRLADLTRLPLPNGGVDVVMSNCVINLCLDKRAVYREALRVLRSSGRIAISDVVSTERIPPELLERFQSTWAGCLAGAIPEGDYFDVVRSAGFAGIEIIARHLLTPDELLAMAHCPGHDYTPAVREEDLEAVQGKIASVKFVATKP